MCERGKCADTVEGLVGNDDVNQWRASQEEEKGEKTGGGEKRMSNARERDREETVEEEEEGTLARSPQLLELQHGYKKHFCIYYY